MNRIEVINFDKRPSVVNRFMAELRDVNIQRDPMRFRENLRRIGSVMAYEISRRLDTYSADIQTPLGSANVVMPREDVVLSTILRAGLPFHEGFLSMFDRAENAFVSAYRKYHEQSDEFEVMVEYLASPSIEGKTLLLVDPMLATGTSMELGYRAMTGKGMPRHIHVACVIASEQAIEYISNHFPADRTTIWAAAIDPEINQHSYIVPGLGDAGDLAFGAKD